ncbi:MAG: PilZ domain-containing protein [Desulfuromonadales bacterium]|nr:MAG: PilZ domain-containing protein [Desulfuromonadales bacterium]
MHSIEPTNTSAADGNKPVRVVFVIGRNRPDGYLDAVGITGIDLTVVESISCLYPLMIREAFHGILLDVPTLVRSSSEEKAFLHDLLQIYPTVRLKWDPRCGAVRTHYYGHHREESPGLEAFVRNQCVPFLPRTIRLSERMPLHLNVMVSPDSAFREGETIRTATMNVSSGGCFIIGAGPWRRGDRLWLRIAGLADATPIGIDVRWCKEWGEKPGMPGIGVTFSAITEEQVAELGRLCIGRRGNGAS